MAVEKLKVMLVDDEQIVADLIMSLLNWEDTEFEIGAYAKNAREALEKFRELCPQIVILDVYMPGTDFLWQKFFTVKLRMSPLSFFPPMKILHMQGKRSMWARFIIC